MLSHMLPKRLIQACRMLQEEHLIALFNVQTLQSVMIIVIVVIIINTALHWWLQRLCMMTIWHRRGVAFEAPLVNRGAQPR